MRGQRTLPLSKWITLQSVPPFLRSCHLHADRPTHGQGDRRGGGGGVGDGWCGLSRLAPLKVTSCLKLRTDDCQRSGKTWRSSRGKMTIVFTCGHSSVRCEANVLNDGGRTCLHRRTFINSEQLLCVSRSGCGSERRGQRSADCDTDEERSAE